MWKTLNMALLIDMLDSSTVTAAQAFASHAVPAQFNAAQDAVIRDSFERTASSSSLFGLLIFFIIGFVITAVVFNMKGSKARRERRERWRNSPGWGATGLPVGGVPEDAPQVLSAEQLDAKRKDASAALIAADEAVRAAGQEVDFAVAAYGEEKVESFRASLDEARADLSAAFERQQLLDDDTPDSPQDQNAWLEEILQRTKRAIDTLQARADEFSQLRNVEHDAPQRIDELNAALMQLVGRLEQGQANLGGIEQEYTTSARERVDGVVERATGRLEDLSAALNDARTAWGSGNHPSAALAIVQAETAQVDAEALVTRVETVKQRLATAQQELPQHIHQAEKDIDAARGMVDAGRSALQGPADRLDRVIKKIYSQMDAGPHDPIALTDELATAHDALSDPLGQAQSEDEKRADAQARLDDLANRAAARIESVEDYVRANRNKVGSTTRTRLSEAQRFLNQAMDMRATDPVTAAQHADRALKLAEAAARNAEAETASRSDQDDPLESVYNIFNPTFSGSRNGVPRITFGYGYPNDNRRNSRRRRPY